jgi:hypothetical protein
MRRSSEIESSSENRPLTPRAIKHQTKKRAACLDGARPGVERVLGEVKRQEKNREQRRAHEHAFVCHGHRSPELHPF